VRISEIRARLDHERAANLDAAAAPEARLPTINPAESSLLSPRAFRLIRARLPPLIELLERASQVSGLQHDIRKISPGNTDRIARTARKDERQQSDRNSSPHCAPRD